MKDAVKEFEKQFKEAIRKAYHRKKRQLEKII